MKAHYDGTITLDKGAKTVHVYRYVRYDNGQNNLLSNTTHQFDTLDQAMTFASNMHDAYKVDGVTLQVKDGDQ